MKFTLAQEFSCSPEEVAQWSWRTWYESLAFLDMKAAIQAHEQERANANRT